MAINFNISSNIIIIKQIYNLISTFFIAVKDFSKKDNMAETDDSKAEIKNEELNPTPVENYYDFSSSPYHNEISNIFQDSSENYAAITNDCFGKLSDGLILTIFIIISFEGYGAMSELSVDLNILAQDIIDAVKALKKRKLAAIELVNELK